MKKRHFAHILCGTVLAVSLWSCDDKNGGELDTEITVNHGVFVLNNGLGGHNNASLTFYDIDKDLVGQKIFKAINNKGLGDTAQDILIYGSKMYITVTNSNAIVVTDLDGREIKTIQPQNNAGPRYMTICDGKVYVSLWESHQVAQLDTTTLTIEKQLSVGRYPEQLLVVNKQLYVSNSGGGDFLTGYDKTVSVIDVAAFSVSKTLQVVTNPMYMQKDRDNNIYLVSMGDYSSVFNSLQVIDADTHQMTTIAEVPNASYIAVHEPYLYAIYAQYGDPNVKYIKYDLQQKKLISNSFISGDKPLSPISLNVDPETGNVYIASTTDAGYTGDGEMFIYNPNGQLLKRFPTGINPVGAYFVNKKSNSEQK